MNDNTSNTLDVRVRNDQIEIGDGLTISFQRTLRIPDDGRSYPLPPGLGAFPLRRIDDYADRVPAEWRRRGGVILPMYQREAMWILLRGQHWSPRAVKVGVGKVCALTGRRWSDGLTRHPQDYLVTPPQPWLDGIAAGKGSIRQFVAMPLGAGYTVEGQVTGEERFGGIQLKVFEPRPGLFPDRPDRYELDECAAMPMACGAPAPRRARASGAMGLGAGGRMKQKIYPDPHGLETWDVTRTGRVFVHLVNSEMWREITGEEPPRTPVTAREYARAGLPWFDLYDEHAATLSPTATLEGVKSIKQIDGDKTTLPQQDDDPVEPGPVHMLPVKKLGPHGVSDGDW